MTEHHANDKRPHGETGDTVQQAAEVSKPTTTVYQVVDTPEGAQLSPDTETGTRASASDGAKTERPGAADTDR